MTANDSHPPGQATPLVRIGSPEGILAVIPCLLGFHPDNSLVVVGAGPPRDRIHLTFRYDLPEPPDPRGAAAIARHAAAILVTNKLGLAIVVGYGPKPAVTPVADAVVRELRAAGITLQDVLRVHQGRYWSSACANPRCCPPGGVPFDPRSHPAARAMATAGNQALRDRAALAATIAPVGGLAAESMRQAVRRAECRAARTAAAGDTAPADTLVRDGIRAVTGAIAAYREGGRAGDDDSIAWMAVTLADLRVRDDAWARMLPEHAEAHLRLWTDVVRRVPASYVPAPASLLAFTAWQAGNGALANVAAERALAAEPEYTMAQLLLDAVGAGLPPSAARLPMTPEEVAASYAGQGRRGGTRRGRGRAGGSPGPGRPGKAGPAGSSRQRGPQAGRGTGGLDAGLAGRPARNLPSE